MSRKISQAGNSVATPLLVDAYKLHRIIFQNAYPHPLDIYIKKGRISVQVDKILNFKYIPFLIALIVISTIIGFGSCVFLPFYKLFKRSLTIDTIALALCLFLGSCSFLQWSTYVVYCYSTEMEPAVNQLFEIEQNYYKLERRKGVDFIGIFLIVMHYLLLFLAPLFPILGILYDLDPFYLIFELILPSAYDRNFTLIFIIPLIRLFLAEVCIFEFSRFICILLFVFISISSTMVTCLRQLIKQNSKSEWLTLQLYTQLRILLKVGDYFLHFLLLFLFTCSQLIMIALWWLVLKCSHLLPAMITIIIFLAAVVGTVATSILLPKGVEICSSSQKFIHHKMAMNHTFNKNNKRKYFYLRWKSQRMLPVRFGSQFTLSKSTPMGYVDVFITNLTNAVLLVDP